MSPVRFGSRPQALRRRRRGDQTGAAVEACARVLKRVGAERIDVLALARVTDPPSCCFDLEFPCLFGYLP